MGTAMRQHGFALARTGSLFLLLQIGTLVGWGLDPVLLGTTAGATAVAAFAVTQRLFQFASQPVAVINAPLWAAYADAVATGDRAFVRKTAVRATAVSVSLAAAVALPLALGGHWLIERWTQSSIDVPGALLAIAAVWALLECWGIAFGTYLNGAGIVREQVIVVTVFCTIALPAKVWAAQTFGATGMVTATTLVYLTIVVGLYATVFRARVMAPIAKSQQ
jgi:O-antigen/teichoic acid export membrane protein